MRKHVHGRDHVSRDDCQSAALEKRGLKTEGVKSYGVVSYLGDLCGEGSTNRTIEPRDTGENGSATKSRHAHAMYGGFDQISLPIPLTSMSMAFRASLIKVISKLFYIMCPMTVPYTG